MEDKLELLYYKSVRADERDFKHARDQHLDAKNVFKETVSATKQKVTTFRAKTIHEASVRNIASHNLETEL